MQRLYLEGHAWWTPAAAGERPAPSLLAANERRRAPDSVLVALEVALAAVAQSGRAAAALASVFTSAHGDLAIVDALCRTLAGEPALLSPTRFHHSVHNAASGYWAIGTSAQAPSTALAGYQASFAAGLLEAASQCAADRRPVLLVGFDTDARGPLASVNTSRGLLGVALVLAPERGECARWQLDWSLGAADAAPPVPAPPPALSRLADNAMADALPLFGALADGAPTSFGLALPPRLALAIALQPLASERAS